MENIVKKPINRYFEDSKKSYLSKKKNHLFDIDD